MSRCAQLEVGDEREAEREKSELGPQRIARGLHEAAGTFVHSR
jgi:hypothetical protein